MKKKRKYSLILVIVVFVLSMGVFFLLYYVDNKYTARGDQAIQGILYVREDDPLHYLTGEWEYYPDLLLTPGELEKHKGEYYSRYISIGEYGGMDLGDKDKSPFGSGTYRMTLVLPEKEKRYAIGLVEVFSSYNLYVNGNLVGQVGNPDLENYKEQIQNRVFTFEGKGNTEIMIAVTDRHSVSSGIQFVPVFGLPLQVNLIRGLSIVGDAVYLALTFCVFLFAVYMFVRTKKAEFCFFALLCICVMGCSSYPVLHAFVPVKVQPAYGLEALFYYLMFACVVVVQQKILCDEGNFSKNSGNCSCCGRCFDFCDRIVMFRDSVSRRTLSGFRDYGSYEMVFCVLSDVQECEGYTAEIQQCSSGGNYCLCFISGSRQNMESI